MAIVFDGTVHKTYDRGSLGHISRNNKKKLIQTLHIQNNTREIGLVPPFRGYVTNTQKTQYLIFFLVSFGICPLMTINKA